MATLPTMISWKKALTLAPFLLVPAAFLAEILHAPPLVTFAAAGLALLPLAGLMGKATEHLATRAGAGLGAFLNATFGNAAELILAFAALREGLTGVVKASITGSIIGNSLLVLGAAILAGGLRQPQQKFNPTAAGVNSTLLALSATALILPATFHHLVPGLPVAEERMSLVISGILLCAYGASLFFAFKTHKHLYVGGEHHVEGETWSTRKSLGVLVGATVLVAFVSEVLVAQVEALSKEFGLNEVFVGVVLLAFFGNAAEHSSAIFMAWRNRMDVALGITVGSSTQIALFVAPVLVFAGYFMGEWVDLVFTMQEVAAVAVSAWIVSLVSHDGESHWLEGILLLAVYAILGVTFFFLP